MSCLLALVSSLAGARAAASQITLDSAGLRPDRTYFGLRKPIPMTVDLGHTLQALTPAPPRLRSNQSQPDSDSMDSSSPTSSDETPAAEAHAKPSQPEIELIDTGTGRLIARETLKPTWADPAIRGSTGATLVKIDLADMFPVIWTREETTVMLAQLVVAGQRRGPPAIVMPMFAPIYAPRIDRTGEPMFEQPAAEERARTLSGVRIWTRKSVVMDTTLGEMEFWLDATAAPITCLHFMELVRDGFYTEVPFHRVASISGRSHADIVQSGDPSGTGLGGPGFFVDLEPSSIEHDFGVLSLARQDDPNSGSSQFFICLNREGTRSLDGRYTAFARLTRGADVLVAISKTPTDTQSRPLEAPIIRRMWLADTPPAGSEPEPIRNPFESPEAR